ncbi:unnamed protein product [Malus baccata var. baccata]
MEDEDFVPVEAKDFYKTYIKAGALSPEIVVNLEIQEEDSMSTSVTESTSKDVVLNDVYVAVGKDDTDALKWTLDNAASLGSTRVFLVHFFPPINHIPTPAGRLTMSQLNEDQVRLYVNEESNKRSYLLQKYLNLCNDAKVTVETMLIETNCTSKLILDLIPVRSKFVKINAPDFCEVNQQVNGPTTPENTRHFEISLFFMLSNAKISVVVCQNLALATLH